MLTALSAHDLSRKQVILLMRLIRMMLCGSPLNFSLHQCKCVPVNDCLMRILHIPYRSPYRFLRFGLQLSVQWSAVVIGSVISTGSSGPMDVLMSGQLEECPRYGLIAVNKSIVTEKSPQRERMI